VKKSGGAERRRYREGDFTVKLLGRKPHQSGTLRGFVDVELEVEHGRRLRIHECPVHTGDTGPWIALPGKVQTHRNGSVRLKPNGKPEYTAILNWGDAETRDAFSRAVIKLLLQRHPDALADEAA
jgi:hypothetical protein